MMNILYVNSSNELYGVDRCLLQLVERLDLERYCPHVALPNDVPYEGLLSQRLESRNIPWFEIKLGVLRRQYSSVLGGVLWGWRTILSALQLAQYCRRHRVQLLHSNSTSVFSGGIAAKLVGIPHVWHVHETIVENAMLLNVIAWMLAHFADVVLAVSGPTRDNLVRANPKLLEKTRVLHNGIDPEPFLNLDKNAVVTWRQTWGVGEGDVVIGTIGRLSVRKGQKEFIQAAALVLKQCSNAHFALVGGTVPGENWRLAELQRLAGDLDIQDRVHWVGFQTDVSSILAALDIFVLPSILPESFPTVVLEAMAAAKPIVATATGGSVEQVEEGINGFLVQPGDPSELAAALIKLIQSPNLRAVMGHTGRERLLNEFTVEEFVQGVETVYSNLCGWSRYVGEGEY
jgi:glycosyltransferase involved in cell wall biosynthesis